MVFTNHYTLEGKHALLSPSKYGWINDRENDILERIGRSYYSELGTQLHDIARARIKYGFKLKKHDRDSVIVDILDRGIPRLVIDYVDFEFIYANLANYVNDAIGYRMSPEVVLAYSDICFGTCDAVKFDDKEKFLRIHDLKTGTTPAHMEQLLIYAALFCLEYHKKPGEINAELRIYQSGEIETCTPDATDILPIMDKIISFDKLIRSRKD